MSTTLRAGPAAQVDRVVVLARADAVAGTAAARWLTADTISAVGRGMAVSICRYRRVTARRPTWAEALAGVEPELLVAMTTVPAAWPLRDGMWRRELRARLMVRLRRSGWVSHTAGSGSLRVGVRGRSW